MPIPQITTITPPRTLAGGRITIHGSDLPVGERLPGVQVGSGAARVVFASSTELGVVVSGAETGPLPVRVDGIDGALDVDVATVLATGLHQVDSPVFDARGNLYVTYSGTRGQQVPVSIYRVSPGGTRETFASGLTNPTGMAIGPDGHLYVSSRFDGAVYRLQDDGTSEVYAADLGIACGLAFTRDGTLLVGDRSGTIFTVSPAGTARTLATLPSSVAAFHLALGPDALYVTAPTLSARDAIYRVSLEGEVSVHDTGFGRPQGITFSPRGDLYVVEALAGMSGVYRVPAGERPELIVAGPRLVGLAFDPDGGLVVCSSDTAYRLPRID
jgi:sugar lactone lactonase YvrE